MMQLASEGFILSLFHATLLLDVSLVMFVTLCPKNTEIDHRGKGGDTEQFNFLGTFLCRSAGYSVPKQNTHSIEMLSKLCVFLFL